MIVTSGNAITFRLIASLFRRGFWTVCHSLKGVLDSDAQELCHKGNSMSYAIKATVELKYIEKYGLQDVCSKFPWDGTHLVLLFHLLLKQPPLFQENLKAYF